MIQEYFEERNCLEHAQRIIVICFYKQCSYNRLACPECLIYHKQHTEKNLIGLDQLSRNITKLNECSLNVLNEYLQIMNQIDKKLFQLQKVAYEKYEETIDYITNEEKIINEQNCQSHLDKNIIMVCNSKDCVWDKFLCCNCLERHSKHLNKVVDKIFFIEQAKNARRYFEKTIQHFMQQMEQLSEQIGNFKQNMIKRFTFQIQELIVWENGTINANISWLLKFIDKEDVVNDLFNKSINLFNMKIEQFKKNLIVDTIFISDHQKKQAKNFFNKGKKQFESAKFQEALTFFNQALILNKTQFNSLYYKGDSLRLLQQYQVSLKWYDLALLIDSKCIVALLGKGESLFKFCLLYYQDSLEHFDQVLALDPKNSKAICGKGNSLLGLNEIQQSIEQFDKALIINCKNKFAILGKGDSLQIFNHI